MTICQEVYLQFAFTVCWFLSYFLLIFFREVGKVLTSIGKESNCEDLTLDKTLQVTSTLECHDYFVW